MATLKDFGLRFIDHGMWSDAEIEWEKSNYQKLLFNYNDVAECTDYESMDLTDENDLHELISQISELTPSGYSNPKIYYEWRVDTGGYDFYDDVDFYKGYGHTWEKDFVLHNTSQALKQALYYLEDNNFFDADIQIFRCEEGKSVMVANYTLQGSTLKMHR